ncbi:hypothetical protein, partial [Brevibacillus formosus]|uniref:hypothetical protein n=1 Tax=Brevibacillus formosus TaxID=54913 RepID=UPI003F1D25D0
MNEEKVLQEFAQSAKQVLRGKYPFDHVALERNVVNRSQKSIRYMKVVKVSRFAGVAACLALLLYATNPVWSSIFPDKEDMNQGAATATAASYQDEGFSYALSHGYPTLPAIKTVQAGYTIQVKDIMVDQLRIAYTVMISGDKIEALAKKPEKEREEAMYTAIQTSPDSSIDIGQVVGKDIQLLNGKHYLIEKGKFELKSSEMKKILSQPNPVFPLHVIEAQPKAKEGFIKVASVSIPLPKKVIDEQKVIMPTAAALAELGDQAGLHKLRVTEIQAFPTAMRVVL